LSTISLKNATSATMKNGKHFSFAEIESVQNRGLGYLLSCKVNYSTYVFG